MGLRIDGDERFRMGIQVAADIGVAGAHADGDRYGAAPDAGWKTY